MASELKYKGPTGLTVYGVVFNDVGQVRNVVGATWDSPLTANWGDYDIPMAEVDTTGVYKADEPAGLVAETRYAYIVQKTSGAPAPGNSVLATGVLHSNVDQKLGAAGLDAISTTAPTGVASNFREMLVQLWRRFFRKATKSTTQIKTYDDAGTGVVTTQTISDSGGTQTQGAAS